MKNPELPPSWQAALADEFAKPYFKELARFVDAERQAHEVFPPEDEVFTALQLTPYDKIRVLLLGQDPYHDNDQAHGLCFSVKPGIRPPPSLANMYKELEADLGFKPPKHGYLVSWAEQGLLMLNAVLTVRAHTPNSHKDKGWEQFTDAVIKKVNEKTDPVVFVLWGGYAKKKAKLIDPKRHVVIQGTHPSPLSASNGFFGSKPYSTINAALEARGKPAINWKLPDQVSLARRADRPQSQRAPRGPSAKPTRAASHFRRRAERNRRGASARQPAGSTLRQASAVWHSASFARGVLSVRVGPPPRPGAGGQSG
jgi:uracil-DNA glycosylase